MHESSLMRGLMDQVYAVAASRGAARVKRVSVRLGAFVPLSPAHFRAHFKEAAQGGIAARARLDVICDADVASPWAQDVSLESIEVEP